MPYSNGRIYIDTSTTPPKGISLTELKRFFKVSGKGLAEIVTNILSRRLINKWSKVKPIDSAYLKTLAQTPEGFKGDLVRQAAGLVYGLRGSGWNWNDIHNANWDYIDFPNNPDLALSEYGGEAPNQRYRVQDFNGYNQNALPTLTGEVSGIENEGMTIKIPFNVQQPFTALLNWNIINNTDGVDIMECVDYAASELYLCVMIDGYCAAMLNGGANNTVAPIYYNGAYCREFTAPELPDELKESTTRRLTLFVSTLDADSISSLKTAGVWIDIEKTAIADNTPFTSVPEAVNYTAIFVVDTIDYGKANLTVGYNSVSNVVSPGIEWITPPTQSYKYRITIDWSKNGVALGSAQMVSTFNYSALLPIISFTPSTVLTGECQYSAKLVGYQGDKVGSVVATAAGTIDFGTSGTN